ncbi:unnamed protein product [Paramecium octaurelia]|uniref:Uncharacterized protein n=1 Tax=Paramecium octaurelia TaxID=43137 RepID=A0A8S1WVP2_PAROT|nr:unnamed protein product [Paramecium octaurelia]
MQPKLLIHLTTVQQLRNILYQMPINMIEMLYIRITAQLCHTASKIYENYSICSHRKAWHSIYAQVPTKKNYPKSQLVEASEHQMLVLINQQLLAPMHPVKLPSPSSFESRSASSGALVQLI